MILWVPKGDAALTKLTTIASRKYALTGVSVSNPAYMAQWVAEKTGVTAPVRTFEIA